MVWGLWKKSIRSQTRVMAEDQQPSPPACLPLALGGQPRDIGNWQVWGGPAKPSCLRGGSGSQARVPVRGCAWRPGMEVPISPSWAQWSLPGVSWPSMECSGGSGWVQLSSCRRRKLAVSCLQFGPDSLAHSPRPRFHSFAGSASSESQILLLLFNPPMSFFQ